MYAPPFFLALCSRLAEVESAAKSSEEADLSSVARPSLRSRRISRYAGSSRRKQLGLDEFPIGSEVLTPRVVGRTWCPVVKHIEGKLQLQVFAAIHATSLFPCTPLLYTPPLHNSLFQLMPRSSTASLFYPPRSLNPTP